MPAHFFNQAPIDPMTETYTPGYSTVAVNLMARNGVDATLNGWTDVMHDALSNDLIHITTSPPGQVLAHYWVAQALEGLPASWSMALRPYQCSDLNVMRYTRGEILSLGNADAVVGGVGGTFHLLRST